MMLESDHSKNFRLYSIDQGVWEATQVDPPSSCRTRGPEVWKLEDQVEGSLDVEDEVFSKAGCLTFVVVHCL
jgi:hypothetical protein